MRCVLLAMLLSASSARAEGWALRGSGAATLMISKDQVERYNYDEISVALSAHVERTLIGPLAARAGIELAVFPTVGAGNGGMIAPTLGPQLEHDGARMRSYLAIALGPALTGELIRPFYSITAGLDIPVSRRISLGPVLGYGQVFQRDRPLHSTDARFLMFGISCRGRLVREEIPPPPAAPVVAKVEAAPEPTSSIDVAELMEKALPPSVHRVELLAPILFAHDSDRLDDASIAMLYEVKRILDERGAARVEVRGYADGQGTREYNESLSRRRAERARSWLIEHGIAPERLTVAAQGVSDARDAAAQERRVVFVILEGAP